MNTSKDFDRPAVQYDEVSRMFRRQGAYGRYKDFLKDHDKLEEWYAFEESETETALREWAAEEGFLVLPQKEHS